MQKENKIICPNCGQEIDIEDVISHQLESKYNSEFKKKLQELENKTKKEKEELEKQRESLIKEKEEQTNLIEEKVKEKILQEKKNIELKLKKDISAEKEEELKILHEEIKNKSEQVKELNKTKALLAQKEREKNELEEKIKAETQKELNETILKKQEEIRKQEAEKNELKNKELLKQLEDQKKLVDELKRKQEQGSMQLQGEIQELAIEEWLKNQFVLDTIEEIKKGARGADCLQTVHTREIQNCGTIYYESKRTKAFGGDWIEKFKADMREKNATIGVFVTDVYPKDMERMGLKDGVWICSYEEFKGLSIALRESLIQIKKIALTQENKGDKMNMLYNFLTGNEFKNQVEAIVEGFVQMKNDLDTEKKAMAKLWKVREKQIEKVLINTTNMYGSIKGIAGNAVQPIQSLELTSLEDIPLIEEKKEDINE